MILFFLITAMPKIRSIAASPNAGRPARRRLRPSGEPSRKTQTISVIRTMFGGSRNGGNAILGIGDGKNGEMRYKITAKQ